MEQKHMATEKSCMILFPPRNVFLQDGIALFCVIQRAKADASKVSYTYTALFPFASSRKLPRIQGICIKISTWNRVFNTNSESFSWTALVCAKIIPWSAWAVGQYDDAVMQSLIILFGKYFYLCGYFLHQSSGNPSYVKASWQLLLKSICVRMPENWAHFSSLWHRN